MHKPVTGKVRSIENLFVLSVPHCYTLVSKPLGSEQQQWLQCGVYSVTGKWAKLQADFPKPSSGICPKILHFITHPWKCVTASMGPSQSNAFPYSEPVLWETNIPSYCPFIYCFICPVWGCADVQEICSQGWATHNTRTVVSHHWTAASPLLVWV